MAEAPAPANVQRSMASGSFDELIHPFMLDSVENFQLDGEGPPRILEPGFSFDGIGSAGLDSDGLFQGSLGSGGSGSLEDVMGEMRKRTRPVGSEAERRRTTRAATADARTKRKKAPDIDEEDLRAAEALSQRREGMQSAQRRKKMYVDFLKQHHGDSKSEEDLPPKKKAKRKPQSDEIDVHEASLRRALVMNFFKYRSTGEVNGEKWRDLVADDFQLMVPRAPYRVVCGQSLMPHTQRLTGIEQLLDDTRSIHGLGEMIRARCTLLKQLDRNARRAALHQAQAEAARALQGADEALKARAVVAHAKEQLAADAEQSDKSFGAIKVLYQCNAREILVAGPLLMCAWRFETSGLKRNGFPNEVSVSGMLKARFREDEGSTKLHRMELCFDCLSFAQQLNAHGLLDVAAVAQAAARARASRAAAEKPPPRKRAEARRKAQAAPGALDAQAAALATQRQQQLLAQCVPYVARPGVRPSIRRSHVANFTSRRNAPPRPAGQLLLQARAPAPPPGPRRGARGPEPRAAPAAPRGGGRGAARAAAAVPRAAAELPVTLRAARRATCGAPPAPAHEPGGRPVDGGILRGAGAGAARARAGARPVSRARS